jgi:hypothetical protein
VNFLRSVLFGNLGLKLAALLLALLVYLNVYLDRPAQMTLSFPVQVRGLGDSLSLSGPVPSTVQAVVRGTGKQLLRLRLTEPPFPLDLEGQGIGSFSLEVTPDGLPLTGYDGIEVDRIVGPLAIDFGIERRVQRRVRVAARVENLPPGVALPGMRVEPETVLVSGPRSALARLDSVVLDPVRVTGRRDTVRVQVAARSLPDWCVMDPALVRIVVPPARRAP